MKQGRLKFFRLLTAGGLGAGIAPVMAAGMSDVSVAKPVKTNIADALRYPCNDMSMPG